MSSKFKTTRRVEFSETDMAGIVHFSSFFRWMEEAEHEFFRFLGFSVNEVRNGEKIGWPRVKASCEYLKPARFEDDLEIRLTVARKSKKTFTFEFTFSLEGEDIARGNLKTVCCRCKPDGGIEPIPIPPEIDEKVVAHSD